MLYRIKRVINRINNGQFLGILYEKMIVYGYSLLKGKLFLKLYSFMYNNLILGKNINCWGRIIIRMSPDCKITMGNNVHIVSDTVRAGISLFSKVKITAMFNSEIFIGAGVGLNGTSITCRTTSIEIKEGTMIAPNVIIVDSDFHAIWPPENRTMNMDYEKDEGVIIGKNVWIGMNSMILKGVTLGDNSIIGAGSVVVSDIPKNTIAAGNPAKVIKDLPINN